MHAKSIDPGITVFEDPYISDERLAENPFMGAALWLLPPPSLPHVLPVLYIAPDKTAVPPRASSSDPPNVPRIFGNPGKFFLPNPLACIQARKGL